MLLILDVYKMVLSQKTEGFLVNLVYSNEVKTSLIIISCEDSNILVNIYLTEFSTNLGGTIQILLLVK